MATLHKAEKRTVDEALGLSWTYTVEHWPDNGGYYVVRVNELPGICTDAETVEAAFEAIQEPMRIYFQSCLDRGEPIPEPIRREDYKGKFSIRTSPEKHYKLARLSALTGTSINSLLDQAIDKILAIQALAG